MISLVLPATSDADAPFVTRLGATRSADPRDSFSLAQRGENSLWCGMNGLFEIASPAHALIGDVVLVDPGEKRAERLLRADSSHNSLLVTEQCDQLCTMCSQPPKKTHRDRFALFTEACLMAEPNAMIGITGGEPTLHKDALFDMVETVLATRTDLTFHILSNAQHFEKTDILRLRDPLYRRVAWGIPIYSVDPVVHDRVVGKIGAFERLMDAFAHLLRAGARIELRTVLTHETLPGLEMLARFVASRLAFIEQWSLMGLENIGFARNRWDKLYVDMRRDFDGVGQALDIAQLHGVAARLFNIPLCHMPPAYRSFAVASISDWKQRFGAACGACTVRSECAGFFEWHPDRLVEEVTPL